MIAAATPTYQRSASRRTSSAVSRSIFQTRYATASPVTSSVSATRTSLRRVTAAKRSRRGGLVTDCYFRFEPRGNPEPSASNRLLLAQELRVDSPERGYRVGDVVVRMGRRQRQGQNLCAGLLRDGKGRAVVAVSVGAQRVHRKEVDARADLLLGEQALVVVARSAGPLGIDPNDVEVERVRV